MYRARPAEKLKWWRCRRAVQRPTRAANDMNVLTQLLLISLCVYAQTASLAELHRRQGHYGAYGPYANEYLKNYEPLMFAAIPLNGPVPVLNVLSHRPLSPAPRESARSPSVPQPVYARPPPPAPGHYRDNEYASSAHNEYEYEVYRGPEPSSYEDTYEYVPTYRQQPAGSASQDEVTILYARPNLQGGYSYRRRPVKTIPRRSPPVATTESPVVLRVHKYKIVRDR